MFDYIKDLRPLESSDYFPDDELFSASNDDIEVTLLAVFTMEAGAYLYLAVDTFGEGVKLYELFEVSSAKEITIEWDLILRSLHSDKNV